MLSLDESFWRRKGLIFCEGVEDGMMGRDSVHDSSMTWGVSERLKVKAPVSATGLSACGCDEAERERLCRRPDVEDACLEEAMVVVGWRCYEGRMSGVNSGRGEGGTALSLRQHAPRSANPTKVRWIRSVQARPDGDDRPCQAPGERAGGADPGCASLESSTALQSGE